MSPEENERECRGQCGLYGSSVAHRRPHTKMMGDTILSTYIGQIFLGISV